MADDNAYLLSTVEAAVAGGTAEDGTVRPAGCPVHTESTQMPVVDPDDPNFIPPYTENPGASSAPGEGSDEPGYDTVPEDIIIHPQVPEPTVPNDDWWNDVVEPGT